MSRKIKSFSYLVLIILGLLSLYFNTILLILSLTIFIVVIGFIRDTQDVEIFKKLEEESHSKIQEVDKIIETLGFQLNELINAIPSPLLYVNQKGEIEVQNESFKAMMNIEPRNIYDIKIESALRQILLDAFLNETHFTRAMNYQNKDYQVQAIPMIKNKRYMGCMMIFQDTSMIVEAEKMQKSFIADASHELKTPITSIKGMIEIIRRPSFNDSETKKEFFLQTEKEIDRLNQIVEDLLMQSQIGENQIHLEKEYFNVFHFFKELLQDQRYELREAEIKVELNCPTDLIIFADQFSMRRVFLNIINNAITYSKQGIIKIECFKKEDSIEIVISDNGKGINEALTPYVFDRFFRGDSDRSRNMGGSGLGLAISKSLIEAHGGSISLMSTDGNGTSFSIKLTQS